MTGFARNCTTPSPSVSAGSAVSAAIRSRRRARSSSPRSVPTSATAKRTTGATRRCLLRSLWYGSGLGQYRPDTAPVVTAPDAAIDKPELVHFLGVVDIAPVDDHRLAHRLFHLHQVDLFE